MVKKSNTDFSQDDMDITNNQTEIHEPELEEIEENQSTFNNSLRDKLKACEAEKRVLLEETQRTKADFLNARRRLEEERKQEREKVTIKHIETLIPLCDSFYVAMSNQETWQKTDESWRKGIEGIYSQLQNILTSNQVIQIDPLGKEFNPYEHEALSTAPVASAEEHDKVISVIQPGYKMIKADNNTELIRPARVTIGAFENN